MTSPSPHPPVTVLSHNHKIISNCIEVVKEDVPVEELSSSSQDQDMKGAAASTNIAEHKPENIQGRKDSSDMVPFQSTDLWLKGEVICDSKSLSSLCQPGIETGARPKTPVHKSEGSTHVDRSESTRVVSRADKDKAYKRWKDSGENLGQSWVNFQCTISQSLF